MNDAALYGTSSTTNNNHKIVNHIVAAGIEINNVTDGLSDHYPAHVSWEDRVHFPHGVDLYGQDRKSVV